MYKSIHSEGFLKTNNWYEYVEYSTTNETTIFLQHNGFSRESATYIKEHLDDFIAVSEEHKFQLKRTLLECDNVNVRNEANAILYNIPRLFENVPIEDISK